jgi:hypothetical protein
MAKYFTKIIRSWTRFRLFLKISSLVAVDLPGSRQAYTPFYGPNMALRTATILLLCLPFVSTAQFANHWVQPGQKYLRIRVASDGIYRVTHSDLVAEGMPVGSIDPRLIQVFHRGVEQAIIFNHSQVPADASFDATEYLEFYGRRNDGALDAALYSPTGSQPHEYYSLYTDSSAYFLTWSTSPAQGKRMTQFDNVNSSGMPKEVAQTNRKLSVYTSEYGVGLTLVNTIQQSFFTTGEGWTGNTICTPGCGTDFRDFTFDQVTNTVPSMGLPHVEAMIVGRDALAHQYEFYAGPTAGSLRLIATKTFADFTTSLLSQDLAWSDVAGNGNIVFRVRAIGVGGGRDRLSVSYIKLTYPSGFDLAGADNRVLTLLPNAGGQSYIEISNALPGTRLIDITDPANGVVIGTRTNGSLLTAVVPNTTTARKILCASAINDVTDHQMRGVTLRNLDRPANFIIVSHPLLTQPASGYSNPVKAYATHRNTAQGGGYDTLTVMIDELYDQFNYGEKSPRAIREFVRMMVAKHHPKYLFIIGKGRELTAQYHRRAPLPGELPDLVPTGGSPASDAVFSIGFDGGAYVPALPAGRLPATIAAQVAAYLNKIKETEAAPDYTWQKRVLHLSGGIQPNELTLYRSYVEGFEEIAVRKYLGADVHTLFKHSVSPVEFINISTEVNAGVNFVTFFGHSSSNATDIDIGYATDPLLGYNNKGKYPVLLVNGCYAGEFFSNGVNFGEDWILAPDKGARNFMANSSFGLDGVLKQYTDMFYETGFGDSVLINKGVGDVQKEVAKKMLTNSGGPGFNSAQVHQVLLLGDPSVRVFDKAVPDFITSDASITVTGWDEKPLHALTDSLKVSVIVVNPGKVSGMPLKIRVKHDRSGEVEVLDASYPSLLNVDTLVITLRRGIDNFFGLNKLEVTLDPLNEVTELNESNNLATWTRNIAFNGTQNIQPAPFGIAGTAQVELLFTDSDLLAPQKTYDLELDTVPGFNSAFKSSQSVTARVVGRATVNLLTRDSLVYYWRTRPAGQTNVPWQTTSFTFIRDSGPGFAQLDFEQMMSNTLSGLVQDPVLPELEFQETSVSVFVKNFGGDHPSSQINGSFQVNNSEYYYSPQQFNCRDNTINLVAFDRSSVVPYLGIPFTFQNSFGRSCGREPMIINSFMAAEVATGNGDDLLKYVDNIKDGDSVVLFSMGDAGFSTWPLIVKQKLRDLGIDQSALEALQDGEPVIIFGKKGSPPGAATMIRSAGTPVKEQELQVSEVLKGRNPSGSIKSVLIGPSLKWKSVSPRFTDVDQSDVASVDAIGVTAGGDEVVLVSNQQSAFTIDQVDAAVYPYLRLQFNTRDEVSLTPAAVDHWIVNFDPAPEGLVILRNPQAPVTVQEGAVANFQFGFVNISKVAFADSLQTALTVFNQTNGTAKAQFKKIKGPAPADTVNLQFDIATSAKLGLNDLSLKVNTGGAVEQYLTNNLLELGGYLNVLKDNVNPLLDVVVDGRYIANGDLVSVSPLISIKVIDENLLLGSLDTTALALFLTYPCASGDCTPRRINFSSNEVAWTSAATGPELTVNFRPRHLVDGHYQLYVQGYDASGNPSGAEPYEVSFEVNSEPSITWYLAYPNPSAGPFFFQFLAAGDTAPGGMVLQVFTREGREVARFDENDAPPLHVGLNQFQWSGLDANGSVLSPGLYLYRLRVYQAAKEHITSGKLMITN